MTNRRSFLKKAGLAGAGIIVAGKAGASDPNIENFHIGRAKSQAFEATTVRIALIGAGGMGTEDTKTALMVPGVELVAVCDLYDGRLDAAKEKWGNHLFVTKDYKAILSRKDVDAVIIGTPDHWHRDISVAALNAGKHVYCEKPMVHSIDQGKSVIDAWKKSGKVMMVGSQGLSSLGNEKAKELLQNGAIGQLNYAEGFWARNSPVGAWQYPIPADASTSTVDWNRYVENTNKRPFQAERFFRWRNYTDYGTGMSGDLFVHLFSSLHFITDSMGPHKIGAMGGLRYWKDGREVPDVLLGMFDYQEAKAHPAFNLSLRCNFVDGTSGTTYLRIVGSEGSMDVEWERVTLRKNQNVSSDDPFMQAKAKEAGSQSDRKIMLPPFETVYTAQNGYKGAHFDHFSNFFNAIRTGGTVAEDPIFGFRAAAPALLCNESYRKNDIILWDPEKMELIK